MAPQLASSLEEEVQRMNIGGGGKGGPSSKIRVQSPSEDDMISQPPISSKQSNKARGGNQGFDIMQEKP